MHLPPLLRCILACSWYLTRLELGRHAGYSSSFAIEQMTRLCQLTLVEDSADVLLPCVSALPQLTRLALVDVAASSLAKLSCLPTQLRELQLSLARLRRNEHPPPGERPGGVQYLLLLKLKFRQLVFMGCWFALSALFAAERAVTLWPVSWQYVSRGLTSAATGTFDGGGACVWAAPLFGGRQGIGCGTLQQVGPCRVIFTP